MILQTIVSGLLLGGLYALAGLSFSLVWGVLGIVNMAHGALITLAAYATFFLATQMGLDPFVALPVTMAFMFLVGYATQSTILNRVFKTGLTMSLIVTFGFGLVLTYGMVLLFSADYRGIVLPYGGAALKIGDLIFPAARSAIFVVALLLVGSLSLFLSRTKLGIAIQATALNREAAQLVGINTPHTYAITYGLGAAIAGAAGALAATVYSLYPFMGDPFISRAFAITVLGGMGNVGGTLFAGLLLGLAESVGVYIVGPGYQEAMASGMVILILLLRPTGLFGRQYFAGTKGT